MTDITLRRADESDYGRIESLLAANDLPHQDVRDGVGEFFIAETDDECVGIGGLETDGSDGLLRSLVVAEQSRGEGYGTALCDALETSARENGVETLYLLTTTAAPFFRRRGYERVERENVPDRVRDTTEFADLCPASATCMRKGLAEVSEEEAERAADR
ncbi:arsenic resistance N-acetyltransferase ArsN2 [Haloarchaeobius salinus]|uniref:arsenic resistance N-acetyltransferase ArsN2 n=1 Tax=Haloarchaeobius salinus TaxID=1198298 RepID=UPI002109B0B2|nr:arsenic resistance N-acetyltransferase ArsN2 [Haloarchaeobius salinus]